MMCTVPQPLSSLRRPDVDTDAAVATSMGDGAATTSTGTGCCRFSWGMGLLWFIIIWVIVWFIIYATKPSWIFTCDANGNKTTCVNYGAVFLASFVVTVIVLIILWILWSAWY